MLKLFFDIEIHFGLILQGYTFLLTEIVYEFYF